MTNISCFNDIEIPNEIFIDSNRITYLLIKWNNNPSKVKNITLEVETYVAKLYDGF